MSKHPDLPFDITYSSGDALATPIVKITKPIFVNANYLHTKELFITPTNSKVNFTGLWTIDSKDNLNLEVWETYTECTPIKDTKHVMLLGFILWTFIMYKEKPEERLRKFWVKEEDITLIWFNSCNEE